MFKKLIILALFAAALIPAVQAAAPDPSAVVTTATTAFEAVATLYVEVFLTGVATFGDKAVVYLSDGSMFTSRDRELEFASKRMAVIKGKIYRFAPSASSNQSASTAPVGAPPFK
jgi:hypothetical protein